jgi:hypothetical protein
MCSEFLFAFARVYATIKFSAYASRMTSELADLASWANEVIAVTFAYQVPTSVIILA